ncbi:MAG: anthranilate phosphoribosyltransferase [Gammaproteobacteria bacterium]|jgi:anthranilate phosphoribosyltransferase|nr:anthranilate phosphoribosyltransferase [Gammaproteobacteria bacterium]
MQAPNAHTSARALMRSIIQRIATGPELSKDISREEARDGMRAVLDGAIDPVQAAIFLIALRMKREADDEYLGILDALRSVTRTGIADVEDLVDLADPYDGFNRALPVSPFLGAVLAACGVRAVVHGVAAMGPKFGVTPRQVLEAAGQRVDGTTAEAIARIENPAIGWAYVDQSSFCPSLHELASLRTLMVKRPALTTVEKLLGPIRARGRTHLVTGYVHKAYPRIYALLARAAEFDSALIVRGVEGGVIPSLRQAGRVFRILGDDSDELELQPAQFGFSAGILPPSLPPMGSTFDADAVARAAADAGIAALSGASGPARESLISAGALCLWHLGRHADLSSAAAAVARALDTGAARRQLD